LAVLGACILLIHDLGGNSGLPPGWDNAEKSAKMAEKSGNVAGLLSDEGLTQNSGISHGHMEGMTGHDMEGMHHLAQHEDGSPPPSGHSGHVMTASMLRVQEQHLWFTLVGIAVGLFKFVHDGSLWRRRFVPYLWPTATCGLGILLVLYTEMT